MKMSKFNLAWLALTYECNNKCKWCYASSNCDSGIGGRFFDVSKEDATLELLSSLGIKKITLIGGEPTIYPNLANLIKKAVNNGITPGIVTNGRKFRDENFVRNLRDSGLKYATFSIEGSSPEIHDGTTQVKGSLDEALEGIRNCIKSGLRVSANTNISTLNKNDLEATLELLKREGINESSFNICGVCISNEGNNQYMLEPREAVNYFVKAQKSASFIKLRTRLSTPMPLCNFEDLVELKKQKVVRGGPCQVVTGKNFVIDYNGDVLPCTHFTGFPFFNIFDGGKVKNKEEFLESYNSETALKFRKAMGRYPSEKCVGCKENCTGGCPIYWTKYDPDREIKGCL